MARRVLVIPGMQAATRLATAFDGPATRAIAIVVAAVVAGMAHGGDRGGVSRTLVLKPHRAVAGDRFERVAAGLPACERYWFSASLRGELWSWPSIAIGPVLAATAIDRTAWIDVLCEGYRTRSWTP